MVKFCSVLFISQSLINFKYHYSQINECFFFFFSFSSQGEKGSKGEKGTIVSQAIKRFLPPCGSQILGNPIAMRMCRGPRDPGTVGSQPICLQRESVIIYLYQIFLCLFVVVLFCVFFRK